jgi:hypothetical protein
MHPHFAEQHARLHRLDLERAAEAERRRPRRPLPLRRAALVYAGRVLVRAGGHLVAGGRPAPAPCPWCDEAFPAHRCLPDPTPAAIAGLRPGC